MSTVLDCISRIPRQLELSLNQREHNYALLKSYLKQRGPIENLVFIASGSSYNSAHAVKSFCEQRLHLTVSLEYPNLFVNYGSELRDSTLYVVISQGGETKLVYEALKKVKQVNKPNCSITADLNCPIAELADVAVDMECGQEEFLYRTVGYSTSVAACFWLAIAVAEASGKISHRDMEDYTADYKLLFESLPVIRDQTLHWYENNRFSLLRRSKMVLAGTGALYPAVNEADIKFMEMVPMFTRSFELEELIHGPQNAFDDDTVYFIYHRKGEDGEKVRAVASFLKNEIGFCAVVGDSPLDERDIDIAPKSRYLGVLEYITVAQTLAYKMADDRGRDLSRGVNSCISNYVRKTL